MRWPESVAFAQRLPEAVAEALRTMGGRTADLIAVGGLGAVWPCARQIAAALRPVWSSGATGDDVAAGATWWGDLCEHPSGMLLESAPPPDLAAPAPVEVVHPAAPNAPLVPPWQRGNSDVF
jgi:hypothetical protein